MLLLLGPLSSAGRKTSRRSNPVREVARCGAPRRRRLRETRGNLRDIGCCDSSGGCCRVFAGFLRGILGGYCRGFLGRGSSDCCVRRFSYPSLDRTSFSGKSYLGKEAEVGEVADICRKLIESSEENVAATWGHSRVRRRAASENLELLSI